MNLKRVFQKYKDNMDLLQLVVKNTDVKKT